MSTPQLGVVVLCYNSGEVIGPCLDGLFASEDVELEVVVCDNASPDSTVPRIRAWADSNDIQLVEEVGAGGTRVVDDATRCGLTLIRSERNLGFAAGVNVGLRALLSRSGIDLFWILNPDAVAAPGAAAAYVRRASVVGPFALMGGRTLYMDPRDVVQSDGGRVNRWTGVCSNVNQGDSPHSSMMPEASTLDFISGANMVASRTFLESVGPMREDYFIYYEEVDWAFRRGDLPLVACPESVVEHRGGTAIGTGSVDRRPSAFANYYNFRNRMRFVRRFTPRSLPTAYVFSMLKILHLLLVGAPDEAVGALRGLHQMSPPPLPDQVSRDRDPARARSSRQVIVNFHGIGEPHAGVPADEVPYWISRERFETIVDRIVAIRRRGGDIRVTFDDGNRSDIEVAAPVLADRGLRGSFFVLSGRVGEEHYLAEADLATLTEMDMEVGVHGQDHVDWRHLDATELHSEMITARERISGWTGVPVTSVSVPFGAYDRNVISRLVDLGYSEIHTSDGGTVVQGTQVLARTSVRADMTQQQVEQILAGREGWFSRLRRRASVTARRYLVGWSVTGAASQVRSLWTRLMLRNTAFAARYGKLRWLYSLQDPWEMSSDREQHRFERTNEILSEVAPRFGNVLELGSGEGHQSTYLQLLTDDLQGLELSAKAVERARRRCPGTTFSVGRVEDVPQHWPGTRFELIVACEVLYYVSDLDVVLGELMARAERLFVSNYLARSEVIRGRFEGAGWRRLPDISHAGAVWECFLWEASESAGASRGNAGQPLMRDESGPSHDRLS